MSTKKRLGMLTPSSNTVLEPVTSKIVEDLENVTAHFSRFRVTKISLKDKELVQFDQAPMLAAAELLADAKVDVISWNGTSASWLGVETDQELVASIQEKTGIKASTCVLSLMDAFKSLKIKRYGLVTPYTHDVQDKIIKNFSSYGFECAAEQHFDVQDNFSFGTIEGERIASAVRKVAEAQPDAIVILCTNLAGAELVKNLENELNIPILDSISLTVWGALRALDQPTSELHGWGRKLAEI